MGREDDGGAKFGLIRRDDNGVILTIEQASGPHDGTSFTVEFGPHEWATFLGMVNRFNL